MQTEASKKNEESTSMSSVMNTIGKKLAFRTDKDELIQKNILKEPNGATGLQEAQLKLANKIGMTAGRRPSKSDLENRNILKDNKSDSEDDDADEEKKNDSESSPSPLVDRRHIGFEASKSQLKSILKKRPEKTSLTEKNILKAENMDPSLREATEKLKRAQLADHLENQIKNRPNPESEIVKKVANFCEVVEVVSTYKPAEYNRKTDDSFTFRRLTPKLKQEIRDELNSFKREEMTVHEDSARFTAFH